MIFNKIKYEQNSLRTKLNNQSYSRLLLRTISNLNH